MKLNRSMPLMLTLVATMYNLQATEIDLDGQTIQLESLESGNCIQVEGSNNEDGTKLIQYPCEANNTLQKLTFSKEGDYYTITLNNGKSLDVAAQSKSNGVNLVQDTESTLFKILPKDGGLTLEAKHSNKYISTTEYNTDIVQTGTGKLPNQLWKVYFHTDEKNGDDNYAHTSCKDILEAGKSIGNGIYTIDTDGNGTKEPFEVYCDMTTDGGGWTEIISGFNTSLSNLAKFGDTFHIKDTFYSDTEKGIGWGTNDQYLKEFFIQDIQFAQMKITFSGAYNNPANGMGMMFTSNASNQGKYWNQPVLGDHYFSFSDAWTNSSSGQTLFVNNDAIFNTKRVDIVNDTYIIEAYNPYIVMSGYKSYYPYTKRYINKLLVR